MLLFKVFNNCSAVAWIAGTATELPNCLYAEASATGIMKTGWMTINGITYYFRSSGAAATGGWYWIGEDRYYFGTEGNMYHDTIIDGIEIGPD